MNGASTTSICPGGALIHPLEMSNPPALDRIEYRVGDYQSFRRALLLGRDGEKELKRWHPGVQGDLAVQLIDWWAYLADILTFYNERIATQAYLRTADQPESVNHLIRLLGYRPRPGIAATGFVAALTSGVNPITLPKGFQIQSKPGPGKTPQIFELDKDVTITPIGPVGPTGSSAGQGSTVVEPEPEPLIDGEKVRLAGASSALKVGDRVLLLPKDPAVDRKFSFRSVVAIEHENDAGGKSTTCITLDKEPVDLKDQTGIRVFKAGQPAQVWLFPAKKNIVIAKVTGEDQLEVHLGSIVRGLTAGDAIVFADSVPTSPKFHYEKLVSFNEPIWFANPGADPSTADPTTPVGQPIPIPHTIIRLSWSDADLPKDEYALRSSYSVYHRWKALGELIAAPARTVGGETGNTNEPASNDPIPLKAAPGESLDSIPAGPVLVEDANGNGAMGAVNDGGDLQITPPVPLLVPPLRILSNLLPVSRGKTVANEVLGSGNALLAGKDFVLKNSPVTYLQSSGSTSGENFRSTVRVWVNQVEWTESPSFFGKGPDAQVFVTREDDEGKTHVAFGDGVNGARLPSGVNNVIASYRHGSGGEAPTPGSLTVVLQPRPGLRSIRNPVAVGGGADPDPPTKVRRLAPRSVLTFGRAVSVDDYQTIAAQSPGVMRARAAVAFDAPSQRPRVTVWVGDDDNAVRTVQAAIAGAADPNRLPVVKRAKVRRIKLTLTVAIDRRRIAANVLAAVRSALADPDAGLLGVNVVGIGQAFFDSQIYAACLKVPGVTAVHSLTFQASDETTNVEAVRQQTLVPARALTSPCRETRHDPAGSDPSEGVYFYLQNDSDSLHLVAEEAP